MKMCSLRLCAEFSVLVAGFWENRCVTNVMILSEMQRNSFLFKNVGSDVQVTIIIIKINKTGALNVYTNVFIYAFTHF